MTGLVFWACAAAGYGDIIFRDSSPSSSWRYGDIVISSITIEGYEHDTDTVSYRIANKEDEVKYEGPWQYDALREGNSFEVKIGTCSYKRFYPGDENFIEWRWQRGEEYRNHVIKVRVRQQELKVIQPGNFARYSTDPVFEFELSGEIDEKNLKKASLIIRGPGVFKEVIYPQDPGLKFIPESGRITYRRGRNFLQDGEEYNLSISVNDGRYIDDISSSAYFMVGKNLISDFFNTPNPFCPGAEKTIFNYVLREDAEVKINIYDSGRSLVRTLVKKERRPAGLNEENWDGKNFAGKTVANGIYYAEIIAEGSGEDRRYLPVAVLR
ncbi:MAG: FlgD immunoglobulin-like domain containing protein [Elusimicrobiota bacterium]